MCIVIEKYFKDHGWVAVKNRDRNYIPELSFERIEHNGSERLLMQDNITKYTEGINQQGMGILSASLMVLDDEKEITVRQKTPSRDGAKINQALKLPDIKAAAMFLIKKELTGNTVIFNSGTLYLLEGAQYKGRYLYKIKKVPHDQTVARTNHGIWLPWAGYQRSDSNESETLSRISSEARLKIANYVVNAAQTPEELIDLLCDTYTDEPQLNGLRTTKDKKMMRTTAQIMLIPGEQTMFIRPVQSHITFNFWQLNQPDSHTWVELLSNRVLWQGRRVDEPPFPQMNHNIDE